MVSIVVKAWLKPRRTVHAHCDLPCGVYDPAQARIEAESVKGIQEKYPQLHQLFWDATKAAGAIKKSTDPGDAQKLLDQIDEIAKIFWETKKG